MTDEQRGFLATAVRAAQAAGKLQQFHVGGDLDITTKSNETDLVTHVDKLCEERIREIILSEYPEHAIWGEEGGQDGESRWRWIVDPIDGTTNYARGFPFYCTSVGLEIDGVAQVGVVFDSVRSELFSAVRGGGAYLNGAPLQVTAEPELIKAVLATGFAYSHDSIQRNIEVFARVHSQVRSVRRPGAAALDLCYVACGRLDGFWELNLRAWDVAAGSLIIQEAGGTVTGGAGEPYRADNPTIVATNGHLHMKLVNVLELGSVIT